MDNQLARATVNVREMILRGRLKPGQRVTEVMLAELLGMSRTPVRQALPVLAREGRFLVAAFHPELTGDTRLHEMFLDLVREAQVVRA